MVIATVKYEVDTKGAAMKLHQGDMYPSLNTCQAIPLRLARGVIAR